MSLSMIEQIASSDGLKPFFDDFTFNKVDTVSNIGDMSYEEHTLLSTHYSTLKIIFPSLHDSLSFIFKSFTVSEIKSIESMLRFYIRLFPYEALETAINKKQSMITIHHRDDTCWVNFESFTIVHSYNSWKFRINDKINENLDMDHFDFENIKTVFINAFHRMFHDIFLNESLVINNELALKVANNQKNFTFNQMRYQHIFQHETDMNFAMHIRDYGNFQIITDRNSNVKKRVIEKGVMGVSGHLRVVKNVLHVSKLAETHISIHDESLDLLDHLFHIALTPIELNYLKKTLEVMYITDKCYLPNKDNEVQIVRANTGKKTIFNLIPEHRPYKFRKSWHVITVSTFISISFYLDGEYHLENVKSFQAAYEFCYNLLTQHVGASLNIDPSDVTELHFKTIEMSNY